ncbi:MAG: chemotaxis response regulator protein-glutamate methylesterase [Xanthobacteraceae bacterium]|nr:chemotaxis response regulator protein-glutamate methylesterase [Xanthobacteraceae bacterium]
MSIAVARSSAPDAVRTEPLRVMVVDDSVVIRGLISRWIEAEPDMVVAASLRTGLDAVNQVARVNPDVAVLDIEMPELDGISALPQLLAKKRDLIVIMASTLTRRNAEISLRALSLGASDYVPKPESTRARDAADTFRRDLIEKIRHLGAGRRRKAQPATGPLLAPAAARAEIPSRMPGSPVPPALRPFGLAAPRALLIGSSTGGPQALTTLIAGIGAIIDRVPVLITQHMPPTFTTILAEHLARAGGRPAHEGVDREPVVPGRVYLAPGGRHMRVVRQGAGASIALDDGPPVNFCKPAVDPLFSSAVEVWQGAILAVVLTGMGSDGTCGGREIVAAGGSIIAQDEASSVVWGMPGAAVNAGICSAVVPLDQIAAKLHRVFSGDRT